MKLKLQLLKLLFIGILFSASELYSQTALPGTVEVETDATLGGIVTLSGPGVNNLRGGSANFVSNSVTVSTAGDYDFEFTYNRTGAAAGSVTMEVVSPFSELFSALSFPQTSGYETVSISGITLATGTYDLKFYNTNGNGFTLDKYVVTETPAGIVLPGTVEVEDGTLAGTATVGDGNGDTSNVVTALSGGSSNSVTNNVSVAEAGYYNFEFTYFNEAAGDGSATMEVVSPSSTLFSTFTIPVAGTTGAYASVSNEIIFLDAGTYELKFFNDNANAISLDNYIVTAYSPTTALPGTVEVEYGAKTGGNATTGVIGSENGGTNNVRTNLLKNGTNTVITNEVSVASGGDYDFTVNYYCNSSTERNLDIYADGIKVGTYEMVKNSDTASTAAYGSFIVEDVTLTAGTYDVELRFLDPGGVHIDNYEVVSATIGIDDIESVDNSVSAYPNPSDSGVFNLSQSSEWEIFSLIGIKVLEGNGSSIDAGNLAKGSYILKIGNTSQIIVIN